MENHLIFILKKQMSRLWPAITFFLLLFVIFPLTSLAHDIEWGIRHGEQNALIIGTIEEKVGNVCSITVHHKLSCGPEEGQKNTIDRMLPVDEIPHSLTADMTGYKSEIFSYSISYHGKEKPEKGDIVLLSLDKKGEIWEAVWPPYELSGKDPQTLELLPEKDKTGAAASWEIFIRSGGRINEFSFSGGDVVLGEVISEDGSITMETLWEKTPTDEADADDVKADDANAGEADADEADAGEANTDEADADEADASEANASEANASEVAGIGTDKGAQENPAQGTEKCVKSSGIQPIMAIITVICILCISTVFIIKSRINRKR